MKNLFGAALFVLFTTIVQAQDNGYLTGGFESNSQWLQDDDAIGLTAPDEQFRSNNYFLLNYSIGKFTAGIQYESYLPTPLLGYDSDLQGNGISNYYLNYKDESLDVTVGYFYEQFGSGLILRAWEERQLGVNTALKGARVKYSPTDFLDLTGVYGEQRFGFEVSSGVVQGLDANIDVGSFIDNNNLFVDLGGSYVGRYQDNGGSAKIPTMVNAYSGRADLVYKNVYANFEAVHKEPDVLVNEGQVTSDENVYKGSALLLTLGYAKSGFGLNTTLRRVENFSFYSDRYAEGNQFNQQLINYVPALTKQHDYLLSNIYVYNPQPRLLMLDFQQQAGEMGGQIDLYYTLKKETALGGKYGTKLAANFAYWGGLDSDFDIETNSYSSKFIGDGGQRYFREATLEIKKRWTKKLSAIYYYTNVTIDKGIVDGSQLGYSDIKANIGVMEHTYRLGSGKSVRLEVQHLWTEQDRKNWAGGLLEYNLSPRLGFYVADSWNYGREDKIHYYNLGGSYTKGRTRVALNYGRQRGGLICVGGVCRFVPENTGLTMNVAVNF